MSNLDRSRSYWQVLEFNEDDSLTESSLRSLGVQDWTQWIYDYIHFQFPHRRGQNRSLTYAFYPFLVRGIQSSIVRQYFNGLHANLIDAVKTLARRHGAWSDDAVAKLLRLYDEAGMIVDGQEYALRSVPLLEEILRVAPPSTREPDPYGLTLSALSRLKLPHDVDWWRDHLVWNRIAYAVPCFRGATTADVHNGLALLQEIDWSQRLTRDEMYNAVYEFLMEHAQDRDVMRHFLIYPALLPQLGADVLEQVQDDYARHQEEED